MAPNIMALPASPALMIQQLFATLPEEEQRTVRQQLSIAASASKVKVEPEGVDESMKEEGEIDE